MTTRTWVCSRPDQYRRFEQHEHREHIDIVTHSDNPASAIAWLARRFNEQEGRWFKDFHFEIEVGDFEIWTFNRHGELLRQRDVRERQIVRTVSSGVTDEPILPVNVLEMIR